MTATTSTTGGIEPGPERWAWTLLPLTLVDFVAGGVRPVSAGVRVSHVAWDGIDGFTGLPETLFDFRPVAVAAALLVVVLLIRRTEARRPAAGGVEVP